MQTFSVTKGLTLATAGGLETLPHSLANVLSDEWF